MSDIDLQLLT